MPSQTALSNLGTELIGRLGGFTSIVSRGDARDRYNAPEFCQKEFVEDNDDQITIKPNQLYFGIWIEYWTGSEMPLEGPDKADALRRIPPTISTVTNLVQIYISGQLEIYEAQLRTSGQLTEEALTSAALLPITK